MSTFRSEQLRQPLSLSGSFTGSLQGTASFTTTASYALFAANGGGSNVDTGSLVTTSSFNAFTSSYNTGSFTGSFTGSLFGTSSWANNATTASIADNFTVRGNLTVSGSTFIGDATTDTITLTAATMSLGSGNNGILNIDSNTLYVDGANNIVGIGRVPTAGVALDVTGDVRSSGTFFGQRVLTNAIQTYNNLNTTFQTGSTNAVVATLFSSSGNFVFQSAQGATDNGYRIQIGDSTSGSLFLSGRARIPTISGSTTFTGNAAITNIEGINDSLLTVSSSADAATLISLARGTTNGIQFINAGSPTSRVQMRAYSASVETIRIDPLLGSFINSLTVSGSFTVVTGSAVELQVTNTGVRIGNAITDIHTVTGSLNISGSTIITGSLNVSAGITGSLFGTSSWATNARTASFLPLGTYNITASWANNATNAGFATTAGNGGVTSIAAGSNISISNPTGDVTVQNEAPRIGPTYEQILFTFIQNGSSDPTTTTLVNTSGKDIFFNRVDPGQYTLSFEGGAFVTANTSIILSAGYSDGSNKSTQYVTWYEVSGSSAKEINIFSAEIGVGLIDDVFQNATVDIKRYD